MTMVVQDDSSVDVNSHPLGYILSTFKMYHLVGGLCGGVTATLITHPFDLIKLRLAGNVWTILQLMYII